LGHKKTPRSDKSGPPFPTKEEILAFIEESPTKVGRREVARAFHIRGKDRYRLKDLFRELAREGKISSRADDKRDRKGALPPVLVIEIYDVDLDGDLLARPTVWRREEEPPAILLEPDPRMRPAPGPGDRILARLSRRDDGAYEARTIRRLDKAPRSILGIFRRGPAGNRLEPTDKRARKDYAVPEAASLGAADGELVLAESMPEPRGRHFGLKPVKIVERIGDAVAAGALSLIAIHEQGLPHVFSDAALAAAEDAGPVELGRREDLRQVPLVTIDGADARDFDDAVFAEPLGTAEKGEGWHLIVAIADVAHYVQPGSALDRAAYERGNSTYFPDRVVPMLPEKLSNGWCSLVPDEERPCMAVHLWINAEGNLKRWKFVRGLMRSASRLTYEQVQDARDGRGDVKTSALLETVIVPLYGAFQALAAARDKRGTLDLDLPERRIILGPEGDVTGIGLRERLDSHRLIEEFMITANVAAASELERLRRPCMYRVHDRPDPVKLEALSEVLESFDLRLAKGQVIKPRTLTSILKQVAGHEDSHLVSELILRSQAQAQYSPENIGHFGLALTKYAHFTSPIRRYADLLVHRALIAGLNLGAGALPEDAAATFGDAGDHISSCERRSAVAERDATDRFTALFLSERVGETAQGRIAGATKAGLFVELEETGADGFIPMSTLPDDYYDHDITHHCLTGRRWGRQYQLGEKIVVRIREANPVTGGVILQILEEEDDTENDGGGNNRADGKSGDWHPLGRTGRQATGRRTTARRTAKSKSRKAKKSTKARGKRRK